MSQQTTSGRLAGEQIEQYRKDGYTLFKQPVFTADQFARLKAIFEENLAKYGEDNLDTMHFRDARLLEFLLSDEVLDLVQPLVGPNIGLWSSHFISKSAGIGKATPWHEDSAYWNGRVSTMEGICTVWLAIDDVDAENGAMKVIPGSHDNGFSEYESIDATRNIFGTQIKPDQIDEGQAVTFELKAGEASLHEARIIHGADANTSTRRRAGYTMRYFPTSSTVFPERNANHKIWLARGVDLGGNAFENA